MSARSKWISYRPGLRIPRCWGAAQCLAASGVGVCLLASTAATALAADDAHRPLQNMSLEELVNVEVTTASRYAEPLSEVASAAYVITRDQIRRSGATSIPEALRLAPGVQVARTGAFSWAITLRGFNGDLSNKLLVLLDGRSVYSPLYAGVFWDAQDTLLEDIDRIEVIAGPGGTLWGANAVNGVINIITKSAADTAGGIGLIGGGGNEPVTAALRYGGRVGGTSYARAYLKYQERDEFRQLAPALFDDGSAVQGGFRVDTPLASGSFTWQGDAYRGERTSLIDRDFSLGTRPRGATEVATRIHGANLLGRWTLSNAPGSELTLQFYVDYTEREIPFTFTERRTTSDIDLQQRVTLGESHELLWGAAVRMSADRLRNSTFAAFLPDERAAWTFSGFVQDRVTLIPGRALLTIGSKLEHNDYTGFEAQPNVRVTYLPDERQTWWGAVSRAVRIPSRLDSDLQLTVPISIPTIPVPVYARVSGSPSFDAERLIAYELGWRWNRTGTISVDATVFYNEYARLQTQEPLTPVVQQLPTTYLLLPNVLSNGKRARSRGGTVSGNWQPTDWLNLRLDYTYFELKARREAFSRDPGALNVEGEAPRHQVGLQSYLELPRNLSLFVGMRYVGELPRQGIAAYTTADASLRWRPTPRLEVSLTGRSLFDPRHTEFGSPRRDAIPRVVYGAVVWRF